MKRALVTAGGVSVAIALEDAMNINVWGPKPGARSASHSLDRIGLPVTLRLWLTNPER